MKTKTNTLKTLAFLVLVLGMFTFVSASLTYSDSAQFSPPSHTYDNPNGIIGYVTLDIKGMTVHESAYVTFNYVSGSSYTTPGQEANFNSWKTVVFTNPNPTLIVSSISVNPDSHVYFKNFNAYGDIISGTNGETSYPEDTSCGDGIKQTGEECDSGESNGVACSSNYGSSCTYCSSTCKTTTVKGEYCGDGIFNEVYERCDDGNRYDNDKCTNECKKPFEVTVEDFEPIVWQCDSRIVYDDATEPGRISTDGQELVERSNNYAFEGEQIKWRVLVMDKNGIDKVRDVYISVEGSIEANCKRLDGYYYTPNNNNVGEISLFNSVGDSVGLEDSTEEEGSNENQEIINTNRIDPSCNARILEEKLTTFNPETMAYYECILTIEPSMEGESEVWVEAEDQDGVIGTMDEVEKWFFNPVIELFIDGSASFDEVRPGTSSYSKMILVGNNAETSSGVVLDMFISGTDFYDGSSSGAKCPTTNQLSLTNFAYYATNGAYSTHQDMQIGRTCDAEGYCTINYGIGFNDPKRFYDRNEIIQADKLSDYYNANLLYPGSEMAIIFRLDLPEPCNGDFGEGAIFLLGRSNMKRNDFTKMKRFIFLALALVFVAFVSAVIFVDAGIRYSYPDSFGTGIAVSEDEYWIPGTVISQ